MVACTTMDAYAEAEAAFFELATKQAFLYGNSPNQSTIAKENVNKILSSTAASLSLVGTLTIFATFWMWPDLRTNSRRMLVYISIGDFLVAAGDIVGIWGIDEGPGLGCRMQGAIGIMAVLPSFFWTVYLSFYFYLTICWGISLEAERRVMKIFHVTAWGIPFTIAVIAFAVKGAGYSGDVGSSGWCWISSDQDWWKMVLWMCISGKGWEISAYISITVFYVLVKLNIRQKVNGGFVSGSPFITLKSVEVAKKADQKLTFIPVVFILVRIWGTIRFFRFLACLPDCKLIGPRPALRWLIVLQGIGDNSQGFANFVLFCLFTDKIRRRFRLRFSRWIRPLRCRPPDTETALLQSSDLGYGTLD